MRSRLPLLSILLLCLAAPTSVASSARGVQFFPGTYEEALAKARAEKKNLLVEVYATWCGPCKRQATEIFDTDDGLALTRNLVAWRVDFDAPEARPLMERWAILSLPTVLFLRPDGREIDRIEGYDDKASFLKEAEARARGRDPLPQLQKRLARAEKAGDHAERLRLSVEVGHRLLVRGETDKGLMLLERAIAEDEDGKAGAAPDALFLLGRYFSRVRRDFETGRHVWRELLTRFSDGPYASTAAWWYAGALCELGQGALAVEVLARRAERRPEDAAALDLLVSFVEERGLGRAEAERLLRAAKGRLEKEKLEALKERLAKAPKQKG